MNSLFRERSDATVVSQSFFLKWVMILLAVLFGSVAGLYIPLANAQGWQEARMNPYVAGAGVVAAGTCTGADTEYGDTSSTGSDNDISGYTVWNLNKVFTVTTGGTVCNLKAYLKQVSGSGNARLAIYNATAVTRVCEGSAEFAVSSGTYGWVGHTYPYVYAYGTTDPCVLSSSTNYVIAISADGTGVNIDSSTGHTAGDWRYILGDYTAGFPSDLNNLGASDSTRWNRAKLGIQ